MMFAESDSDPPELTYEGFHIAERCALTLMLIKKYRKGTILDRLPRDIVAKIAQIVLMEIRDDYTLRSTLEAKIPPLDPDQMWHLFTMGSDSRCPINPGSCYMFTPMISFEDARRGYWHKMICSADQD